MIELNVRALTDLSLRFVDSLARHQGGILNVASLAAFVPGPDMAIYHATKAYALSLSEALAHELGPKGIRVTVLCPGPVKTEFQRRSGLAADLYPQHLERSRSASRARATPGSWRGGAWSFRARTAGRPPPAAACCRAGGRSRSPPQKPQAGPG